MKIIFLSMFRKTKTTEHCIQRLIKTGLEISTWQFQMYGVRRPIREMNESLFWDEWEIYESGSAGINIVHT